MTAHAGVIKPPIPEQLAHLPSWKGLVVPFVQVVLADGSPDFRSVHESKRATCITNRRCGVCGEQLDYYIYFLGTAFHIKHRLFTEPGLHEVCCTYTEQACAMVAGRLDVLSARSHRSDGKPCSDPDCECAGWIARGPVRTVDHPREDWWRLKTRGYKIRHLPDGSPRAFADSPLEVVHLG